MEIFDNEEQEYFPQDQSRSDADPEKRYQILTVEDHSLEGVGIGAGEAVVIELWEDGEILSAERHAGALLCFANRHGEIMIGRYAPPYIELPYRDKTYRVRMGGRWVVGYVIDHARGRE